MKARALSLLLLGGATVVSACGTDGDLLLGRFRRSVEGSGGGQFGSGGTSPGNGAGGVDGSPGGYGGGVNPDLMPCSPGSVLPLPDHRFDFSGSGVELVDVIGGDSGELIGGAELDGTGRLQLDGDDDYADLPNGLLGGGSAVSVMVWVAGPDGPAYWRVFDFGISRGGEDPPEFTTGAYYVAVTAETGFDPSGMALLAADGGPSSQYQATSTYKLGPQMVAVTAVVDSSAGQLWLYVDGQIVADGVYGGEISEIDDVNNWLGRSQYSADPFFPGTYQELRVYHRALSACQVSALTARGANNP